MKQQQNAGSLRLILGIILALLLLGQFNHVWALPPRGSETPPVSDTSEAIGVKALPAEFRAGPETLV